jgi:YHS domain-containing protein
MKGFESILVAALVGGAALSAGTAFADDKAPTKPKPYTLKTCVVSDEKLGEMGDPYLYVHEGREIKFCCKNCVKDFKKDPAKYIKKIEEAEAKEKQKKKS